jgi:pSer/pThr/pTyr-binding forkhead associated (FHA) protein
MACLVVIEGPATGQHFALAQHKLVAIGRDDDCTFQIVDPLVSRRHLQIRLDKDGNHIAADYRSANGVIVNGARLVGDRLLRNGDEITIGGSRIVYSTDDYTDAASAMADVRKKGEWKRSTIMRD